MKIFDSISVLGLILIISESAVAEKPWTEIRSPHFRVLTNGEPADARKVACEI
jgi:hypothetical protein